MEGYLMELQPFSVNDGDGIRTTIFLAGCPLRCRWCSNPEGWECREQVGKDGRMLVRLADADDILADIQKHRLFYAMSGGGITFSGGEATAQPAFLDYLSREIYDMGYHMAIETCGYFDFDLPEIRAALSRMDLIFIDLKSMDDAVHCKYTGVSNQRILENIQRLSELPADVVVRIPVVPGVNDNESNIRESAGFVHRALPEARMELLAYHKLGSIKYEALGLPFPDDFRVPTEAEMDFLRGIVREKEVNLADYR